ncbi:unnamed protein product [Parascedosporium putredinis]|uniref:Cytochrome P450 n=1 Tax=Parascedosporium putredinis TaxID=1442378 RepID=A0A9P1GYB0_9PEZI|nr:unnamed protein product [Parascedosporium putredinis]CAI7991568.1 unnamed protein product [Parascedosporium putredinis]
MHDNERVEPSRDDEESSAAYESQGFNYPQLGPSYHAPQYTVVRDVDEGLGGDAMLRVRIRASKEASTLAEQTLTRRSLVPAFDPASNNLLNALEDKGSVRSLVLHAPGLSASAQAVSTPRSVVFWALFLFQYLAIKFYRIVIHPRYVSSLRHLPGVKKPDVLTPHKNNHILFGQTLNQFLSGDPTQPYVSWVRKWPDADMIRYNLFGTMPAVLVTSPEAFRQILQPSCYEFTKPSWYKRLIFPIVGKGLVFLDGEEHKRHRKIISGAFALSHLKQLIPLMEDKATELCTHLDTMIGYDRGVMNRLALTAINSIVPIRWISVGENRRFNRAIAQLHELLRRIISERIADMDKEKTQGVLTFMAAGHETTSNTLAWAIHYLGLNRPIQDRLRKEMIDAVGPTALGMEYNTIDSLPLLDNVYREILRVKSSATFATRESINDVEICGTVIPKGTTLMLMPSAIHQNPRIWGDSVDEFDPDRWDRLEGEAAKPNAFSAFFMGPRGCIGQVYTRLEFKVMMIAIIRRFEFDAIEKGEVPLVNPSVVLRPKGGLRVFAHRLTPKV